MTGIGITMIVLGGALAYLGFTGTPEKRGPFALQTTIMGPIIILGGILTLVKVFLDA